jgi:hypothetical protein
LTQALSNEEKLLQELLRELEEEMAAENSKGEFSDEAADK